MLKDIGFIVKIDIKSDPGNTTFYLFDLEQVILTFLTFILKKD